MEGEKFYLNKELIPTDEAEKERIAQSKEAIGEMVQVDRDAVREESIEFSPEMLQYIAEAKEWHENRFRAAGVTSEIQWGELFKIPNAKVSDRGAAANAGLGTIKIGDLSRAELFALPDDQRTDRFSPFHVDGEIFSDMSNEEAAQKLREYVEALYIAHELYHDAADTSVFVKTKTEKETGRMFHVTTSSGTFDRTGLFYGRHMEGGAPALEEGLAMIAQEDAGSSVALQQFPKGAAVFNRLLDYAVEKDPRLADIPRKALIINNFDGDVVVHNLIGYTGGYVLANYLHQVIPNFVKLAEKARIDGETLALARAIEKKFGKESYKKIVTCTEEKALDLVEELQKIEPQKAFPVPQNAEAVETMEKLPSKSEILESLRNSGRTAENIELVTRWVSENEKLVKTPRDTVLLNISMLDFYEADGDEVETWEAVKEAYANARRENEDDLVEQLLERYPKLAELRLE